jgi:hypothetical protein
MFNVPYNTTSVEEEYLNIRKRLIVQYSFNYENFKTKFDNKNSN